SPMTAPVAVAVSSRARWVGTRRTTQCTSRAAAIQPQVIHSAVRAECSVRGEITARTWSVVRPGAGPAPYRSSLEVPGLRVGDVRVVAHRAVPQPLRHVADVVLDDAHALRGGR